MRIEVTRDNDVVRYTRRNSFMNDVEDYYDRLKKGVPPLYSSVPSELGSRLKTSSNFLARTSPRDLAAYNGYLAGLSYDKRGRFVANLGDALATLQEIV